MNQQTAQMTCFPLFEEHCSPHPTTSLVIIWRNVFLFSRNTTLCFGVKHSPGRKTETNIIECDIEVETSDHPAKY